MSSSGDFHLTFRYRNDDFSLVRAADSAHPITINGVTYDVIGSKGKLEDVYKLLRSAPLESVLSEADLKAKLSSLDGISFPTAKATHEVGKKHVAPAKTAEDITRGGTIRPRSLSNVGHLSGRPTEKQERAKKSGELWECVGRKPDKGSHGYLYIFKLRDEFDTVTPSQNGEQRLEAAKEKIASIYPAVEISGENLLYLNPKVSKETFTDQVIKSTGAERAETEAQIKLAIRNDPLARALPPTYLEYLIRKDVLAEIKQTLADTYARRDFLWALGYGVEQKKDGLYLTLPDRETLLARWEKLREKYPQLLPLDIVSSEGIASDMAFIEAYLQHDVLLSEGKEFVHDQTSHIIPTLVILKEIFSRRDTSPSSAIEKWNFIKVALAAYRKLMIVQKEINDGALNIPEEQIAPLRTHLDKIALGLSAYVDSITSISTLRLLKLRGSQNYLDQIYNTLSTNPKMSHYLKNRFGEANEGIAMLGELWDQMNLIEQAFNAARQKNKEE